MSKNAHLALHNTQNSSVAQACCPPPPSYFLLGQIVQLCCQPQLQPILLQAKANRQEELNGTEVQISSPPALPAFIDVNVPLEQRFPRQDSASCTLIHKRNQHS